MKNIIISFALCLLASCSSRGMVKPPEQQVPVNKTEPIVVKEKKPEPIAKAKRDIVEHTVIKNDTLWDISFQYKKNNFKWTNIYDMNTNIIKDPDLIYPNQRILIQIN